MSDLQAALMRLGLTRTLAAIVEFADGQTYRVSTYLDGQAGLNEAAAHVRSLRQVPTVQPWDRPSGQWLRDAKGAWRLVPELHDVPAIASVRYVDARDRGNRSLDDRG